MKAVIGQCKKDVKGGLSLTDAFSKHPNVFNRLYVNMVKAAEAGGILDKILERLSGFLEKEQEIRGKIKSAMIYPILVLVFATIMVIVHVHRGAAEVQGDIRLHERRNAADHEGAVRHERFHDRLLVYTTGHDCRRVLHLQVV